MWNTQEHLEAYFAVPHAGRGAPHAEHPPVPRAAHVHREPRRRPRDPRRRRPRARCSRASPASSRRSSATSSSATATSSVLEDAARDSAEFVRYDDAARRRRSRRVRLPRGRRVGGRGDVLHERHHRQPEGRRLLAPLHVPAHDRHPDRVGRAVHVARPPPADRADVPRQRVGRAVRGVDGRRRPAHARAATCRPNRWRKFIANERPTTTCAVPTIWADLLRYSEDHEVDFSSLAADHVRRRGRAARADGGVPGALRRPHAAGVGHDRDQPARGGVAPAARRRARHHGGDGLARARPAGRSRASSCASSTTTAPCCRGTARRWARSSAGARGSPARTTAIPRPRSSTTAGCAPATSPASRPTATCRSPTGRRTSSSRAGSGSRRSSSRVT